MIEVETWEAAIAVGTIAAAILGSLLSYRASISRYMKLPQSAVGDASMSAVQAADKAMDMLEEQYVVKLEHVEERVGKLESELSNRIERIIELEEERTLLLRWISVLTEQIVKAGEVPISLDRIKQLDEWSQVK